MQNALRKIKKVRPVVRARQAKVDQEATELSRIRQEKTAVVEEMKRNQKRYMEGVEQLNTIRSSKTRDSLTTLENALDQVKGRWYALYKKVQFIENQEHAQMANLLTAQRDLKVVEKLQKNYEREYYHELQKTEQRQLDETTIHHRSTKT